MIKKWLRQLGLLKTLLVLVTFAVLTSTLMYGLIGLLIGSITGVGLMMAVTIPVMTAPVLIYYLLRMLHSLDLAEQALQKNEQKYRHLVQYAPAGIYEIDLAAFKFVAVNDVMCEYTGYTRSEFLALSPFDLLAEEGKQVFLQRQQQMVQGETIPTAVEYRIKGKNGREFWVLLNTRLMHEAGQPTSATVIVYDITERKKIEDQLRDSLREKEVLLQEIHHRVKNNLQVISSLLNLQAGYVEDERALGILQESQHRVRSMALMHENLYRSKNLARIDFNQYIHDITAYLLQAYRAKPPEVRLIIEAEQPVWLNIDQALPCGLILNELMSNALKHAFVNTGSGTIRIELDLTADQRLTLTIADNGIGLPATIDPRQTGSLGLNLVYTLAHQLEATVELNGSAGTKFSLTFRII